MAGETPGIEELPTARTGWRRFAPVLVLAGLALAGTLVWRALGRYDLHAVLAALQGFPPGHLLRAGAFAAASYVCLTGFDALAVHYAGASLPYRRIALASFTALSLGHTLGLAALSSGAVRFRFYRRWGLRGEQVARIILFCGLTVGLGLLGLAGGTLLLWPSLAALLTGLQRGALMGVGWLCLGLLLVYLLLTLTVRRPLCLGRWMLRLPDAKLALAQLAVGTLNFALVAACLHQALLAVVDIAYPAAAAAYAIANSTALLTHVPGGLGVIESVIALLVPGTEVLAALVVFRCIYFLLPFLLGCLTLLAAEMLDRWRVRQARTAAAPRRSPGRAGR